MHYEPRRIRSTVALWTRAPRDSATDGAVLPIDRPTMNPASVDHPKKMTQQGGHQRPCCHSVIVLSSGFLDTTGLLRSSFSWSTK